MAKVVVAAGERQIRDSIRASNPFTVSKRLKRMKETIEEGFAARKGFIESAQRAFDTSPVIKYGELVFSGRAIKEYKKELVLNAVRMSEEATAIRCIQESVSRHVRRPVSWLQTLEL
jgi:hypothetical protein